MNTPNNSTGILVEERVDGHLQRGNDGWVLGFFDHFDVDPGVRKQRRASVVKHKDLQRVAVFHFVVESLGRAQRAVLVNAEGIIHVTRTYLKREWTGVRRSISIGDLHN